MCDTGTLHRRIPTKSSIPLAVPHYPTNSLNYKMHFMVFVPNDGIHHDNALSGAGGRGMSEI